MNQGKPSRTWQALDEVVGAGVRDEHVLDDQAAQARAKKAARGKGAEKVAAEAVYPRLVEGAPVAHARAKRPAAFMRPDLKNSGGREDSDQVLTRRYILIQSLRL